MCMPIDLPGLQYMRDKGYTRLIHVMGLDGRLLPFYSKFFLAQVCGRKKVNGTGAHVILLYYEFIYEIISL
jgi:hypothetical protein